MTDKTTHLLFVTVAFAVVALTSGQNSRPIIGILTTPSDFHSSYPPQKWSYFPASYAKFIEHAGARVVPIPYDASPQNLTYLFSRINGLLFTGGGADLTILDPVAGTATLGNVTVAGAYLINLAIEANQNGNYFPIWVTCQGWELLSIVLSQDPFILDNVTGDTNMNRNMSFTYNAGGSRFYSSMSSEMINWIQTLAISYFDHNNSVSVESFYRNPNYPQIMDVSTIAYAGRGRSFIGTAEGRIVNGTVIPIYGNQFHAEKNTFEWKPAVVAPHSWQAVEYEQYCANFLVQEARKNNQSFNGDQKAENDSLIYRWNVKQPSSSTMGPCYFFPTVITNPNMWPNLFSDQ